MSAAINNNRRAAALPGERGEITPAQWHKIKCRSDFRCVCCGQREPAIKLTIDHVVPLSRGGRNTRQNVQALCEECNQRKGDAITDYRKRAPRRKKKRS